MDNIIITVKDDQNLFSYDMEIPAKVPMGMVIEQLIGNLALLNPAYPFNRRKWSFVCGRTGKEVSESRTAQECGIWNGDYIIMRGD